MRIVTIDLEKQEITGPDGGSVRFEIDPFRKHCLLNGLDDIGLTLEKAVDDRRLRSPRTHGQPWLWARPLGSSQRHPANRSPHEPSTSISRKT